MICKIGSIDINSAENLQTALRGFHAGDTVEIVVYRGKELSLSVTLDEKPEAEPVETELGGLQEDDSLSAYVYPNAANW